MSGSRVLQNQLYSSYDFYFSQTFPIYAAVLLVVFYLSVMKAVFNTYSPTTAYRNYRTNEKIRARYHDLFGTRNSLLYHISWAQSRREFDQAKTMTAQLKRVDDVCTVAYRMSACLVSLQYMQHLQYDVSRHSSLSLTDRRSTASSPAIDRYSVS